MNLEIKVNAEHRAEREVKCPLCGNVWGEKLHTSEAHNDDMHMSSRLRTDWYCVSGHVCYCVAEANSAEVKTSEIRQKTAGLAAWEKLPLLSAKGLAYQTVETPAGKMPVGEFLEMHPDARVLCTEPWFASVRPDHDTLCGFSVNGDVDGNGSLN